jgi:CheY-like chemotaxis protein
MPEDVAKKAFEPFFTTKEVGKGTGLGLSMVYGFLEQSGGLATLRSEVGVGTTIRLYFPRVDAQATLVRELELNADTPAPTGDETVLVVEDDNDVRGTAAGALRSLGYTVLEAATAQQALEVIRGTTKLHLLFTDVTLPGGIHGPDLARRAQSLVPELKVLFTSGFSESAIIHRGILDGTLPLIPKPYAIVDLARRVRATLRQS